MSHSASLVDTNVWIAVAFPAHQHHATATEGLTESTVECPALFCRSTEQSFLRIATTLSLQRPYGAAALTNRDAIALFNALMARPEVGYREEPVGIEPLWHYMADRTRSSPKVWMDAYLAAFAIVGDFEFVSFDKGFEDYCRFGLNLRLLS